MVKFTHIFKAVVSLWLTTVFTTVLQAQEAEQLFKTYKKWGLTTQFNVFDGSTNTPAILSKSHYELLKSKMPAVGVEYNVYQTGNWNFKTGLQLQFFTDSDKEFFADEDMASGVDWSITTIWGAEIIVYLPLSVQHIFPVSPKTDLTFTGGIDFSYFKYNEKGWGDFTVDDVEMFNYSYDGDNFFTGAHVELGAYFKRKGLLIEPYVTYKKSFKDFQTGEFTFKNLQTVPDQTYQLSRSGDYIGGGVRFYLKKETKLFKKKKG